MLADKCTNLYPCNVTSMSDNILVISQRRVRLIDTRGNARLAFLLSRAILNGERLNLAAAQCDADREIGHWRETHESIGRMPRGGERFSGRLDEKTSRSSPIVPTPLLTLCIFGIPSNLLGHKSTPTRATHAWTCDYDGRTRVRPNSDNRELPVEHTDR